MGSFGFAFYWTWITGRYTLAGLCAAALVFEIVASRLPAPQARALYTW